MRCLVADRSATLRALMSHALRRANATEVVVASSVEEAVAACETAFDLIVVDRDLGPGPDWEWLAALRQQACSDGRLIATGTRVSRDEVEALRALGCGAFLLKPLDPERLAERASLLMSSDADARDGQGGEAPQAHAA